MWQIGIKDIYNKYILNNFQVYFLNNNNKIL